MLARANDPAPEDGGIRLWLHTIATARRPLPVFNLYAYVWL